MMAMTNSNVLLVYYSRTGVTRRVAEAIRSELGCEAFEVHTDRYPQGVKGFLRAGWDALRRREVPIEVFPSTRGYDMVIIGTPVWGGTIAAPIRTYLSQYFPNAKQVAFFLTHGSSTVGNEQVLEEMERICGKVAIASVDISILELRRGSYYEKVRRFIGDVRKGFVARAA